ncbi:hypothetical protein [Dyadobacter sp. OTU695]|uniref:hypothetical protein n=1 Tax=Dyadobacter sp. OTU695 TaxID=3043860 RepID=UPI00313E5CA7
MGIFKGLINLISMKINGQDTDPDHLMIDKIIFLYKFLSKNNSTLFANERELIVFVMSVTLSRNLRNESIDIDYLYQVVDGIYQNVDGNLEKDKSFPSDEYKLYLIAYDTMSVHYHIVFGKYHDDFEKKTKEKLSTLNEYINIKAVREYKNDPEVNTAFKKDLVNKLIKELTAGLDGKT